MDVPYFHKYIILGLCNNKLIFETNKPHWQLK